MFCISDQKLREREGGLQTKGYFKKSIPNNPIITVITVVFNGEKHLEKTIKSVIRQTYDNIEYIIIDGGSKDGTLDIIKKYEDQIDYWISEKDYGIYDAMNKGLDLVNGDWINFMNVGDFFYKKDVINNIFSKKNFKEISVIYGNLWTQKGIRKNKKNIYVKSLLCKTIGHQCLFIKKKKHCKFNTQYKISADYDLLLKLILNKEKFYYTDNVVAFYDIEKTYMNKIDKLNYAHLRVKEKAEIVNKLPYPYILISKCYYHFQCLKFKLKKYLFCILN